jgi:hypothetical protein
MTNSRAIGCPLPRLQGRVRETTRPHAFVAKAPSPTLRRKPVGGGGVGYLQKPERLFRSETQADAGNLA